MGACTSTTQKKKNTVVRQLMAYKVNLTAYIWSRNAHNLFDFESNQCTRKDLEIDFSARLATLENDLLALTKNEWARNQTDIVDLNLDEDETVSLNQISPKQDHRVWAVIKNRTGSDFNSLEFWNLRLNDIIKLGRIRLQLMDFAFLKPTQMDSDTEKMNGNQQEHEYDPASCSQDYKGIQDPIMCRICFSRKATVQNPLISPCLCTGSVKYIHVGCLQSWIGVQLKIKKGDNFVQYTWKKMSCEICKATFKNSYVFQERTYNIMNIPKPTSSYLTLRVTSDDKCKEGMIYVVEFQDKTELKIGRVPECDIKLKDISVSRQHAILKLVPTENHTIEKPSYQLRLQDINSKFGTLVLAQTDDLLKIQTQEVPVLYQVGRVLMSFSVTKKTKKLTGSCYKHPEGIPLFNVTQVPLNDLATNINQQQQNEGSFQTHNELNLSDIVIHDQAPVQNAVRLSQSQPLPLLQPPRVNIPMDDDLSVCDEHQ